MMKVVEKIKKLQKERGWTVNRMALECNISCATILNWYNHNTIPSVPAIAKVCEACGISLSDFFYEGEGIFELTKDQKELLDEWSLLDNKTRKAFLGLLKTLNWEKS